MLIYYPHHSHREYRLVMQMVHLLIIIGTLQQANCTKPHIHSADKPKVAYRAALITAHISAVANDRAMYACPCHDICMPCTVTAPFS